MNPHNAYTCPCVACRQWRYQMRRWNLSAPEPDWYPERFR